ncbi:MAG: hypothetical protein J6T94_09835 [Bacteroidaceae bacterium]|nr:hypothetical protein [Bacteroidaceae bacterium]
MNLFGIFKKKSESGLTYSELETWLNEVMQMTIPDDVVAFCFNLYEDANKSWTLELIGASSFDTTDNDWACDEVFTTRDKPFTWKENKEWQDVQITIIKMIKDYIEKGKYGKTLKERQGLAVGFVDGDLTPL